jgi:DUF1680 family protein
MPNQTLAMVTETCWAHRILLMTGDAQYAKFMERGLYNGAVSGISLGGDRFFYENRLASRGGMERWAWHRCLCCPANIARLVASVGQYVASANGQAVTGTNDRSYLRFERDWSAGGDARPGHSVPVPGGGRPAIARQPRRNRRTLCHDWMARAC